MAYNRLRSAHFNVLQHEDPLKQALAESICPVDRLSEAARAAGGEEHFRELLLLELLAWFKGEFFTWCDKPKCPQCNETAEETLGSGTPTHQQLADNIGRIEVYKCTKCNLRVEFPRHNDPEKLLETRTGRCGEWANCFLLFCRALHYEARQVLDWTDHVWVEVYSHRESRWLHCDPCENVCDKPLLYEQGWKKKLTYLVAFQVDDVVDVTWRYVIEWRQCLTRRTSHSESDFASAVSRVKQMAALGMTSERRAELERRQVSEWLELLTPRQVGAEEEVGRQSGALRWRQGRGEIHDEGKVITPTAEEILAKRLILRYNSATDTYNRSSDPDSLGTSLKAWQTLVHKSSGITHMKELDWKMAYLASEVEEGTVEWYVQTPENCQITSCLLRVQHKTYEEGVVTWSVLAGKGEECSAVSRTTDEFGTTSTFSLEHLSVSELRVIARVKGGKSWQHAQLFRQPLSGTREGLVMDLSLS